MRGMMRGTMRGMMRGMMRKPVDFVYELSLISARRQ